MTSYRRLAIALIVPILLALIARRSQTAATPAEFQRGAAQPTTGQAAPPPGARGEGRGRGAQGTPGPTTELLRLMAVDKPDFGIKVIQTFDASGKPAYDTKGGDLLFITNASVSYN